MNKEKKKKKRLFKNHSITFVMFGLSFGTIIVVLLIGALIIGVIAPRVYSNTVMNEIETNLVETVEYYDFNLKDIALNPLIEIDVESYPFIEEFANNNRLKYTAESIDDILAAIDDEQIVTTVNVQYVLGSIAMSRGAIINITDQNGNLVYETPNWFKDNVGNVHIPSKSRNFISNNPFIDDLIEDNTWISRSSTITLDEEYTLNVRFDLRSFNQNIMIFNRMFFYLIAVAGLFAIIFSIILSFIVTKPLKELKKIASSMENMDFSIRYTKNRNDEIGQLGKTLNHMMDRLGITINKLQAELQKEKRTDKLRKEFVAQVSHELKTPVAIVSNYTEALLDGVADTKEEQDSYLGTIENECRKMAHMINDLLDLSQMEAGTFNIIKEKFEFKDLLEDLAGKYDNMAMGEYEFITNIQIEKAAMYGDELRIEQAISNLLSNAIKHTKQGNYIKLSVTKENSMVHIQIENQGEPIDSELLVHIWDSFVKGSDEKGAGLGLSITKNIVELHNGEYYVTNLDNSVLFGIRLPII